MEAAELLVAAGASEQTVAAALQLPMRDVKTLYAQRTEVSTVLQEEDKQLADAMRQIAWKAVNEAFYTLEYGHTADKQALVRTILGKTMGLVGAETTQRFDEMRGEFESLLTRMTTLPEGVSANAELGPPAIDVDDPDEGSDDGEV